MNESQRRPKAFVIDQPHPSAKRSPRQIPAIDFTEAPTAGGLEALPPAPPRPRAMRWGALLIGALASLVTMAAGLGAARLIEDFFARSAILGWIAAAIAGLAAVAALAILFREIWSLARLRRIEHIQAAAVAGLNRNDKQMSANAVAELKTLYQGRPDMAWALRSLAEHDADIVDARDRLRLAERYLLDPLDAVAHRIIARAARRVTVITTVTPTAALDMLFVGAQNLRMLRELATLYGGRPSTLATLRLARMVVSHLAVTGGLALSDSLLQHVVGKGLVGRLSARFGEGAVNGILTSRVGLAARDVCRPIPQQPSRKETLGNLLRELVSFSAAEKTE